VRKTRTKSQAINLKRKHSTSHPISDCVPHGSRVPASRSTIAAIQPFRSNANTTYQRPTKCGAYRYNPPPDIRTHEPYRSTESEWDRTNREVPLQYSKFPELGKRVHVSDLNCPPIPSTLYHISRDRRLRGDLYYDAVARCARPLISPANRTWSGNPPPSLVGVVACADVKIYLLFPRRKTLACLCMGAPPTEDRMAASFRTLGISLT
jgi:hypothetical protein